MLTASIKIGESGSKVDITTTYGLVYLDSDKRVSAPIKEHESTSYPEEEGEHINPLTVDAPFDYKVKFFIDPRHTSGEPATLQTVNATIKAFNDTILPLSNGVRTAQKVEFYNDYKRHKIVGYPQPIAEATEFWRDPTNQVNDVVVVEWTIRVTKPSDCEFNYTA